jgi:hypothetical protein
LIIVAYVAPSKVAAQKNGFIQEYANKKIWSFISIQVLDSDVFKHFNATFVDHLNLEIRQIDDESLLDFADTRLK